MKLSLYTIIIHNTPGRKYLFAMRTMERAKFMQNRILLIGERGKSIGFEFEKELWLEHQFFLHTVITLDEAKAALLNQEFLLVVIFLEDYLRCISALREVTAAPIIISQQFYLLQDKIAALDSGADLCAVLPLPLEEWVAIVKAFVRRYIDPSYQKKEEAVISYKEIMLYPFYRKALVSGAELQLTRKQFDILSLLLQNPGHVFSYEMLYNMVWGNLYENDVQSILWNHVSKLRRQFQVLSFQEDYIKTVRGVGYKIE